MVEKVVGKSMMNLTKEEMENIYGTNGDLQQPNTTPTIPISAIGSAIGSWVGSKLFC